jgi:hypothetical protein
LQKVCSVKKKNEEDACAQLKEENFSSSARSALGLYTYRTRGVASVRVLFRMPTMSRKDAYTCPERRQERGVIVGLERMSVDGVVAHGMGRGG